MPTSTPVCRWKSRAASIMQSADGSVAPRPDLARRRLDEVGTGRHRQHRRLPDTVVAAELARLQDHLEVGGAGGLARGHELVVRLRVPAAQEQRAVRARCRPRRRPAPRPRRSRAGARRADRALPGTRRPRSPRARRSPRAVPRRPARAAGTGRRPRPTGSTGRPGPAGSAFEQIATILPTVSVPSSVVRSMQRIARSSAQSFEDFLIDRFARDAARSSSPTASTATVRAMSRCASAPPDNTGRRSLGWIWAAWDIGPIVADPTTAALRDPAMLIATDETQAERTEAGSCARPSWRWSP